MVGIILASLLLMLISLAGIISVWEKAGNIIEKNLGFLISLSAGVFVVITYNLAKEALGYSENLFIGISWILFGALAIWFMFKLIPFTHHHDLNEECEHQKNNKKIDARKILIGGGIHNIGDGILLTTAFSVSNILGILTTLGISIHKIVKETSQFFILRNSGYSIKKALKINFLISSTILIGSIGGFFALKSLEILEVPLLGLASGTFLIVIIQDLIPHSLREHNGNDSKLKHMFKHMFWFLLGVAIMISVNNLTSKIHTHKHDDIKHNNEQSRNFPYEKNLKL